MATRKKKKKFSATKAVKSMAREMIGSPPPVQRIPTQVLARTQNLTEHQGIFRFHVYLQADARAVAAQLSRP